MLLLVLGFGVVTMMFDITIVATAQNRFIDQTIEETVANQHVAIAHPMTEALVYDDIYTSYTLAETVTKNIPFISNVIILDAKKNVVTDSLVTRSLPEGMTTVAEGRQRTGSTDYFTFPLEQKLGWVIFVVDLNWKRETILSQIFQTVGVHLLFVILLIIPGIILAVYVTKPLSVLTEQLSNATLEKLPFTLELPEHTTTEVRKLAETLTAMAERLKQATDQLTEQEKQMAREEKLASIGMMAAGLAHEIRNPLMTINMLIHSAKQSFDVTLTEKDLAVMMHASDRVVSTLNDFLSLTRPIEQKPSVTSVQRIRNMLSGWAASTLEDKMQLHVQYDEDTTLILDEGRVMQVAHNLLINSADAGATECVLTIETQNDMLVMTFADNGKGVHPADAAQLFRPFFTTKAHGTGLGLSMSELIAQALGGSLTFVQQDTRGAQFVLSVRNLYEKDLDS